MSDIPINQIVQGDCLVEMAKLPDACIDFICTDLPFGITDAFWDNEIDLEKFWQEARRILKPCASAAMFASGNFVYKLHASNAEQYRYKWIWAKNMVTDFVNAKNRPMRQFEEILMFSSGKVAHIGKSKNRMNYYPQGLIDCNFPPRTDPTTAGGGTYCTGFNGKKHYNDTAGGGLYCTGFNGKKKRYIDTTGEATYQLGNFNKTKGLRLLEQGGGGNREGLACKRGQLLGAHPSDRESYIQTQTGYPKDILNFKVPYGTKKRHPNEKPVDLLEYLIKTYTQEGELVLDATCGSGSTCVAAINTNRNFIGIELEERFCAVAQERIDRALAEKSQVLF